MTHDERTGEMTGFIYGQATGGEHAGMQMGPQRADSAKRDMTDHSRMNMPMRDSAQRRPDTSAVRHEGHQMADSTRRAPADSGAKHMEQMMDLHRRLMADPVIRDRIMADTAMRRMIQDMMRVMPAEHRQPMEAMMAKPSAKAPAKKPAATKRADPHAGHNMPAAKPAPKAAPKKPAAKKDSMAGMDHSKMTPKKKP
jgi:hypothetical protein